MFFIILLSFLFSVSIQQISASDLTPQRIILESSADNRDSLLARMILDLADNNTNIYLFPADSAILERFGVKTVHVRLLLSNTSIESYETGLYQLLQSGPQKISVITFPAGQFINNLSNKASVLLRTIIDKFPPVPRTVVQTVTLVSNTVSEFESPLPRWSLEFLPLVYMNDKVILSFSESNSSNYYIAPAYSYLIFQTMLNFHYRAFSVSLSTSLSLPLDNFDANLDLYWGLFDSILKVGMGTGYLFMNVPFSQDDMKDVLSAPVIRLERISIFMNLLFHINRNYSIEMKFSPPITGAGLYWNFTNENGAFRENRINLNESMIFSFLFRFRLWQDDQLVIFYRFHAIKARSEEFDEIWSINNSTRLDEFKSEQFSLGLGYRHVF